MAAPTIKTGILTGGSNNHATTSEEANAVATDFVSEGIVGTFTNTSGVAPATGAFAVNASGTPDANINISTGIAYVTATPSSQNSQALRINCSVAGTLAISSNSSGSTKYDWIYISVNATNAANPNSAADDVATIVASRSSSASTDDGTPPTYGYPIAVVTVANGFSTITNGNIRDVRTNSVVNLGSSSVSSGWVDLGYTPNTVTANGNRSYDLVFNSTNLTSTLSPGMRLKTTRLVTAPTQCTDLESGSSQYYSRASAGLTGMTFTDDFTVMAWVKLESYAQGQIISRYSTNGYFLRVDATGQVVIAGGNGGALDFATTYQSLPLNKWVHVAATLDISGAAALTYIDGVSVPNAYTNSAATSVTQSGDFCIGALSGGSVFFDGKIAQAAVFSSILSAATIRSYMSQGLAGNESTLISAYSFNNAITDLNTTNANNLTANGSAVATNADSPFSVNGFGTAAGTTDFAIVTKSVFSTNTTLTVQVPEGNTIPTSGGVSAVAYSGIKAPYGMPVERSKWTITSFVKSNTPSSGTVNGTYYNPGSYNITLPIGKWLLGYQVIVQTNFTGTADVQTHLSTSASAVTVTDWSSRDYVNGGSIRILSPTRYSPVDVSSATPYYFIFNNSSTFSLLQLNAEGNFIVAELALL